MEPISLSPAILFYIGSFPITNSFFWSIILSIVLIVGTLMMNKKMKQVPGRIQCFVEVILEGAYSFVGTVVSDKEKTKKVFPLVFTMFIFILVANLATYIPGQSAVYLQGSEGKIPLFRAIMADYGMVFVLTIISIISVQIVAIAAYGPFGYVGKFLNLKGIKDFFIEMFRGNLKFSLLGQGFLDLFLGLMDLVGEISKIVSLSFRLFGNIFAGEVLGLVALTLMPFLAPLPFLFLGLLTAVIQAFVFSVLTLIFITMASEIPE